MGKNVVCGAWGTRARGRGKIREEEQSGEDAACEVERAGINS